MSQNVVHMVTIRFLWFKMVLQIFFQTRCINSHVSPFGNCGAEICTWPLSLQEHIRAQARQCLKICDSIAIIYLIYQINAHTQLNKYIYYLSKDRDSSVGIATRYGLDGPGIESRWGRDIPQPSRPALRATQPPIQWVPGLPRG